MNLNNLTPRDQELILRFTKAAVDSVAEKQEPVRFSLEMDDESSLKQVTQQARDLAERRNRGVTGRSYKDESPEGQEIREQVQKFLRSRKLLVRDK